MASLQVKGYYNYIHMNFNFLFSEFALQSTSCSCIALPSAFKQTRGRDRNKRTKKSLLKLLCQRYNNINFIVCTYYLMYLWLASQLLTILYATHIQPYIMHNYFNGNFMLTYNYSTPELTTFPIYYRYHDSQVTQDVHLQTSSQTLKYV